MDIRTILLLSILQTTTERIENKAGQKTAAYVVRKLKKDIEVTMSDLRKLKEDNKDSESSM